MAWFPLLNPFLWQPSVCKVEPMYDVRRPDAQGGSDTGLDVYFKVKPLA